MSFVYEKANLGNSRCQNVLREININEKKWYVDPIMLISVSDFWKIFFLGTNEILPADRYEDDNPNQILIDALNALHMKNMDISDFVHMINILEIFNLWLIPVDTIVDIFFPGYSGGTYPYDDFTKEDMEKYIRMAMPILMDPQRTLQEKFAVFFSCPYIENYLGYQTEYSNFSGLVDQLFQNEGISFLWRNAFPIDAENYQRPSNVEIYNELSKIPDDFVSSIIVRICISFLFQIKRDNNINPKLKELIEEKLSIIDIDFQQIISEIEKL